MLSQIDLFVKVQEIVRVHGDKHNAAEGPVRLIDPPCQLNGPFTRGSSQYRFADEKFTTVNLFVHQKMFKILGGYFDKRNLRTTCRIAVFIGNTQMQKGLAGKPAFTDKSRQIKGRTVRFSLIFQKKCNLIQPPQRSQGMLFKRSRVIGRFSGGVVQFNLPLALNLHTKAGPDNAKQDQSEQHGQRSGVEASRQTFHGLNSFIFISTMAQGAVNSFS